MRIALILTYPIYHDGITVRQWLKKTDRERWLANLMTQMGHHVELWAVADEVTTIEGDETKATLRFFKNTGRDSRTKFHQSRDLLQRARDFNAHLHILKGVDGGTGTMVLKDYLIPHNRPFGFIIGGEYYSKFVPQASVVFYESDAQKQLMQSPFPRLWRKPVQPSRLLMMPKLIDTQRFCPMPEEPVEWDILVVGRLMPRYKRYDALGVLSRQFKTAVIGDGPEALKLKKQYPEVEWLGAIPNRDLPRYYNRARIFMHTSLSDYYPRVLAEALSCGVPCVAFEGRLTPQVLPPQCGLLVPRQNYSHLTASLLDDPDRLHIMATQARNHALKHIGPDACRQAIEQMFLNLRQTKNSND